MRSRASLCSTTARVSLRRHKAFQEVGAWLLDVVRSLGSRMSGMNGLSYWRRTPPPLSWSQGCRWGLWFGHRRTTRLDSVPAHLRAHRSAVNVFDLNHFDPPAALGGLDDGTSIIPPPPYLISYPTSLAVPPTPGGSGLTPSPKNHTRTHLERSVGFLVAASSTYCMDRALFPLLCVVRYRLLCMSQLRICPNSRHILLTLLIISSYAG